MIVLIEDNVALSESIALVLRHLKYEVTQLYSISEAVPILEKEKISLVILDLGLPDGDGLTLCRTIRKAKKDLPILILTARVDVQSKVYGLDCGADDYLCKPFAMDELLARVRALLRRTATSSSSVIKIGAVEINLASHTVLVKDEVISLSPTEVRLMRCLLDNRKRIVSQYDLYTYVWEDENGEISCVETVKVHIARIRKKLGKQLIRTVSGCGYMIE